jgi:hypothetical protein
MTTFFQNSITPTNGLSFKFLCSQNGNQPLEDLAKFGNKWNINIKVFKHLFIMLATHLK